MQDQRAALDRSYDYAKHRQNPRGHSRGYIPASSSGESRQLSSHETACLLNTGDKPANVAITVFFADREPVGSYRLTLAPRRTLHLRFNELQDPQPIPTDTD